MKLRVSRNKVKQVGLNSAVVFSELAIRAAKATLSDGEERFFFSPVGRSDSDFPKGEFYRPLEDILFFMGEQTIRDCIDKVEKNGYLDVWKRGNRWDKTVLPSGKTHKKRTHRYHIPDDVLAEHQKELKESNGYLVVDTEIAGKYGLVEAIILNLLEMQSAKLRKTSVNPEVVTLTVDYLAKKIGVSASTVRRGLKSLVKNDALTHVGGSSYKLNLPTTVELKDSFELHKSQATVPLEEESSTCESRTHLPPRVKSSLPSNLVPTGIHDLDAKIGTFAKGELAFLMGQTGHGKTITMLNFAVGAAMAGYKPLIFSLEMSAEDLQSRLRSNVFQVECNKIRTGEIDSERHLDAMSAWDREMLSNIKIIELAERATIDDLNRHLNRLRADGYHPDVILIDQFSYLMPIVKVSNDTAEWKNQKNVADDLAHWAKESLDSDHPFCIWCLHQANGDPALQYGRESISGYKAVIEPASLVVGIGHTDLEPRQLRMFSLKNRHGSPFKLTLPCDFSKMKVGSEVVSEGQLALVS